MEAVPSNNLAFSLIAFTKTDQGSLEHEVSPNVAVEWLTHLLRIRKVPGSNLGPETRYPIDGFRGFPQLLYENAGIVP
jgi:hypothetical protein